MTVDLLSEALAPEVLSVSELAGRIQAGLEDAFSDIWVEGEVSSLRTPASGHAYFTLKDARAQLACVLFRGERALLPFEPEEGMLVLTCGRVTFYPPQGRGQLGVRTRRPRGEGALDAALRQLRARLDPEGLFDPDRKRPLPPFPERVALVTSLAGAAVRDMARVLHRRGPGVHILIYPTRVQGEGAAEEIARAVRRCDEEGVADLIIVGRGGGSREDLWAFNEEGVVRAIAGCETPIISAVGHEIDFTLADLAADLRAPTPSAAAELAVRAWEEWEEQLRGLERRLLGAFRASLEEARARLSACLASRPFARPRARLEEEAQHLDELWERLLRSALHHLRLARERQRSLARQLLLVSPGGRVARARERLEEARAALGKAAREGVRRRGERLREWAARLEGLSPLAVLARGYSICRKVPEGTLVREAAQVRRGEQVSLHLARGELGCRVEEVHRSTSP
ncbi:MAG: exodeoxyribonuclease VII large subunit [Nitrospinota bacterium]